jgi:hypothetical protein
LPSRPTIFCPNAVAPFLTYTSVTYHELLHRCRNGARRGRTHGSRRRLRRCSSSSLILASISNRFPVSVPQSVVDLFVQLSDIASSRPSLSVALRMLGTLPALRSLTLVVPRHFVEIIYSGKDPTPETCLPHLDRLIIDAPPDFNAVLQSIQAPVLQCLHLRSTDPPLNYPHDGTGEALLRFLRSSKPPMKLLELYDVDIRRDDFRTMLSFSCPSWRSYVSMRRRFRTTHCFLSMDRWVHALV